MPTPQLSYPIIPLNMEESSLDETSISGVNSFPVDNGESAEGLLKSLL